MTQESPKLRPARLDDLEEIGYISHQTGLLGDPIGRFFPDQALWADVFIRPYLEAGCCNFVIENKGHVAGYIIGSCSPGELPRWLVTRLPAVLLDGFRQGRYSRLAGCLPYLARFLVRGGARAPGTDYPAELHIGALPGARGRGLGAALMGRFLDCLHERGVRGVQLATSERNAAALRLYERFGFRVYARWRSRFWEPYLGIPVEHLRLVKELA